MLDGVLVDEEVVLGVRDHRTHYGGWEEVNVVEVGFDIWYDVFVLWIFFNYIFILNCISEENFFKIKLTFLIKKKTLILQLSFSWFFRKK